MCFFKDFFKTQSRVELQNKLSKNKYTSYKKLMQTGFKPNFVIYSKHKCQTYIKTLSTGTRLKCFSKVPSNLNSFLVLWLLLFFVILSACLNTCESTMGWLQHGCNCYILMFWQIILKHRLLIAVIGAIFVRSLIIVSRN